MATVELIGITKRFGGVEACAGVDLKIEDREFVTLLGPSGCGKSTTLNIIAGLDDPSSGEILMDGEIVNEMSPVERDIAMVFQQYALYPHMNVAENIGFTLRLQKRPKSEIKERVARVAELLELTSLLHRLPRELSGGQQQRVAIGRAVIREPKVFLFDEPFSNLDAALRIRMRGEVKELHRRLGATSIFVTHDQEEALSISDRVAVMRAGKVEQYGTAEEIYSRPATAYVAQFIGSPKMQLLQGDLVGDVDDAVYRIGDASFPILASLATVIRDAGIEQVDIAIRPEHIHPSVAGFPVQVLGTQTIGPETHVTFGLANSDQQVTARIPGIARFAPGEYGHVTLDTEHLLAFDRRSGRRIETN